MKNTFKLVQILQGLNRIKRAGGGQFLGLPDQMRVSIAEHSYCVTYLAMMIAQREKVDDAKLLRYCLVHDWTESVLGDLPSGSPSWQSFWEANIRDEIKKAGSNIWTAMGKLVEDELSLNQWSEVGLNEIEKKIVETADMVAMLLEMLEWKYLGLKHEGYGMIWFNTIDRLKNIDLKSARELTEELNQADEKGIKEYNVFLAQPSKQTNPKHKR